LRRAKPLQIGERKKKKQKSATDVSFKEGVNTTACHTGEEKGSKSCQGSEDASTSGGTIFTSARRKKTKGKKGKEGDILITSSKEV